VLGCLGLLPYIYVTQSYWQCSKHFMNEHLTSHCTGKMILGLSALYCLSRRKYFPLNLGFATRRATSADQRHNDVLCRPRPPASACDIGYDRGTIVRCVYFGTRLAVILSHTTMDIEQCVFPLSIFCLSLLLVLLRSKGFERQAIRS
jgi:hypothetical protein